jgi:hypothetical protein
MDLTGRQDVFIVCAGLSEILRTEQAASGKNNNHFVKINQAFGNLIYVVLLLH